MRLRIAAVLAPAIDPPKTDKDHKDWADKLLKMSDGEFSQFTKDRTIMDNILGQTGNRLEFENEICAIFGYKEYHDAPPETQKLIGKFYHFILSKEMTAIELTMNYMRKHKV